MRGYNRRVLRPWVLYVILVLVAAHPSMAEGAGTPPAYTWVEAMAGTAQLHRVLWDGQQFVAVGDKGALWTSPEGIEWTRRQSGSALALEGIAASPGGLVAVGAGGLLLKSQDGRTWTAGESVPTGLSSIAFGQVSEREGVFVAVGTRGTIVTSHDGSSWEAAAGGAPTSDVNHIIFAGAHGFVAVGNAGALLTSRDGRTWAEQTVATEDLYALAYGGLSGHERFVAVGRDGLILSSRDGHVWGVASAGHGMSLNAVAWCGSRFLAAGAAGTLLASPDGTAWTTLQSPTDAWIHGIAYNGHAIVMVGDQGQVEVTPSYAISGTLTGFADGLSVTVTAGPGLSHSVLISGVTNYSIINVPNGVYTLTVSYVPSCPGYNVSPSAISVTVNGANVAGKNFTASASGPPVLASISPSSGPVSGGTVVTATGANFFNCSPTVTFGTSSPVAATVVSNTQLTVTTPAAAAGQAKVIVTTASGSSTQPVYFAYLAEYSVKGTIYQADGTTVIAGATVTAVGGGNTVTATSGADGAYSLDHLVNATYTLSCSSPGLAFTTQSVVVSGANRTGINFTAQTPYTLSGAITFNGTGLVGVSVSAGVGLTGSTDASGNFIIPNVPNGTYTVTPSLAGYYFAPASRSVTVSGADVSGLTFVASQAFTISGLVTLQSGTGLAGVSVSAGGLLTAVTNAAGAYTINSVAPGVYTVRASLAGYVFSPTSAVVTVTTSNLTGVSFVAKPVFPISGLVTLGSATGRGLAGVAVSAGGSYVATTAADGTYLIPNVPASTVPYSVVPTLAGYTFTPTSLAVTVTTLPVTGINFVAASLSVVARANPASGAEPLTVSFASTVTGGVAPYTFDWSFGDATAHGTGASVSHTYTTAGTYSVTLTVTDSARNRATDSHLSITVQSPLSVKAQASPMKGSAPLPVAFEAAAAGGQAPYTITWAFGDGATGTGPALSHTYATGGSFTARVTVLDAKAASSSDSLTITVVNPPVVTVATKITLAGEPFRLKIMGSNFHGNCTVLIGGVAVPETKFKSPSLLIAKKGGVLKAMVPKGVPVQITVRNNDDGGVSAAFTYIR